jgi:N6-adenosine-specific RNA methylase IME4
MLAPEAPGRSQVSMLQTRECKDSRKPDDQFELVEPCSTGPYLEGFGRGKRTGWAVCGNRADDTAAPASKTYADNSSVAAE